MTDDVVICAECLMVSNIGERWWKWHCLAHPRPQTLNTVTGLHVADPPYRYCKDQNQGGNCPDYEPNPQGSLLKRRKPDAS